MKKAITESIVNYEINYNGCLIKGYACWPVKAGCRG